MYRMYYDGGPGHYWFGPLAMMLVFWLVIALVAWAVWRNIGHHHHSDAAPSAPTSAAVEALKMRFAKGEIDEDEFHRRLTLLQSTT